MKTRVHSPGGRREVHYKDDEILNHTALLFALVLEFFIQIQITIF